MASKWQDIALSPIGKYATSIGKVDETKVLICDTVFSMRMIFSKNSRVFKTQRMKKYTQHALRMVTALLTL